jgi:hypothetical protein
VVTVSDTPFDFERTDSFTLEAWVKTTKQNGSIIIDKKGASASGFDLFYEDTTGLVRFWLSNSASNRLRVHGSTQINDGAWHHVVATYAGTSLASGIKIFVDGVSNTITTDESTPLSATILNNSNLQLGFATAASDAWQGTLDDVRVYNYVLTPVQVAYNYNRGAPIAHYKFDECQGTTAYNSAVNANGQAAGNNGTITPGDSSGDNDTAGTCSSGTTTEMWNDGTTGKRNASLGFDGTNDYVDLGTTPFLSATADFTITSWINPSSLTASSYHEIFSQGNSSTTDQAFRFAAWDQKLHFSSINDADNSVEDIFGSTLSTGAWQHVAITKSGSNYTLYLNGRIDATDIEVTSGTYTFNTVRIGAITRTSTVEFWNGLIDDLRVYNYALTAEQIKQVMNNGAVFFGPNAGSP